jgi:hypothetical protein
VDNQQALPTAERLMDLVIDSAGKVHSAKMVGDDDKSTIAASSEWRFVPAFRAGQPVASWMRLSVTPYR